MRPRLRAPTSLVVTAVIACLLGGCTLEQRVPVREVALDFSDHDFYDRAYAPSPDWRTPPGAETGVEHSRSTVESKPRAGGPAFSQLGR